MTTVRGKERKGEVSRLATHAGMLLTLREESLAPLSVSPQLYLWCKYRCISRGSVSVCRLVACIGCRPAERLGQGHEGEGQVVVEVVGGSKKCKRRPTVGGYCRRKVKQRKKSDGATEASGEKRSGGERKEEQALLASRDGCRGAKTGGR